MEHAELVALIRNGVPEQGGVWAELGAGWGNFTRALSELVGPDATIYAVDRDERAMRQLPSVAIPIVADFTHPLPLPELDGVLMANSLHFVRRQAEVVRKVAGLLRPGGRFLLVEYGLRFPLPWVPHPVSFERWKELATEAGLSSPTQVGERRSPRSGTVMYGAVALRPTTDQGGR